MKKRKQEQYLTPEEIARRKRRWWLFITLAFAVVGGLAFLFGYALKDGWASVAAWFTSKWATYLYLGAAVYAFLVFLGYKTIKVEEMTK